MNNYLRALRAGLARGRIELRQRLTTLEDLVDIAVPVVVLTVVMLFMRGSTVPDTQLSRAAMTLPSVLGMVVGFTGLVTVATTLTMEREDGTLLRAKAVPFGLVGYTVGKVVQISGSTLVSIALLLIPGLFLFDGVELTATSPITLAWVLGLGLLATMPFGAIFGSLTDDPRHVGFVAMPILGIIGISGIFYPITGFPGWLQAIAQVFPMYWLGLGMRSALLPDAMAALEIGGSWRHLETFGVLTVWAVVGLAIAPMVLRRMARRESGSSVAARREKALRRATI